MKTLARKGVYKGHRRWAPYAARAAGFALNQVANYGRRRLSQAFTGSTSQKTREMAPLTAEKDVRLVYRKRRMPRRKRKRYVRMLKKFRSMKMTSEPSRIHFLVDAREYSTVANTSRYFGCFMGLCANNFYDTAISNLWENLTGAGAVTKARHATLRLDHMGISTVLRNTTTTGIGILDVDVYKVICIRDIPLDRWVSGLGIESFHAALKAELRQATGMDLEVTDAGAGIPTTQTNAGTSSTNQAVFDVLFNAPPFLRYWRIVKCWKVQLGVGQTVSFNWRDTRNRAVARPECIDTEAGALAAKKGLTKGYIFNINGRWNPTASAFEPVNVVCET